MDFHNMNRKQLQALCKKHKIPANLSNFEMASKLMVKGKEDPLTQRLIKGQEENASETESADVVVNRKVKKVRFSPEHELIEFTRSRDIKRRSRRNSVLSRKGGWSVENVDSGEMNKENLGGMGRVTRSRTVEAKVNEKKRGIIAVKCNDRKTDASAIEIFDNGKSKEEDVDSSGRVTLLRGKMAAEGVKNASRKETKRAKYDGKRDEVALDNVDNDKLIQEVVDNPSRLTRSRAQKLTEASAREEKRGRKAAKRIGNVALVRAETNENRVASTISFMSGGDAGEGELAGDSGVRMQCNGEGQEEVLENKKISGEHDVVERQIFLRRSKRNANRVPEILNADLRKHENGEGMGLRQTSKLLAPDGSGVHGESTGRVALKTEPIKVEPRRSNRRENVIRLNDLKAESENRNPLSSVLQSGIAGEVSKDEKKVLQPAVVLRGSRRKALSLKLVSGDEKFSADSAKENLEAEKHRSQPCLLENECPAVQKNTRRSRRNLSKCKSPGRLRKTGGDSIIHQNNEAKKRKRGPTSGGDVIKTNNNPSSVAQTIKEHSRKKAMPAAGAGKVSDKRTRTCRLKNPKMLDASLHNGSKIRSPTPIDVQPSVSEGLESTNSSAFSTDTSPKNIISEQMSSKKVNTKKSDISTTDSAGSSNEKFNDGEELVNSGTNAASRITELITDCRDFEEQVSASNIRGVEKGHSPLEFDAQELIEQNVPDKDKNDTEAQLFSRMKDSGCDNKIDNQVLPVAPNISGEEGFADRLLLGDQTADLEEADFEADKCLQPSPSLVDHVGEAKGTSVKENLNLDSDETRHANDISSPISCHHIDMDNLEASAIILDNNNEDTPPKAGEVAAFDSCERRTDHTHLESKLTVKVPSGDDMGNEASFHKGTASELAESNDERCINNHKSASQQYSEFGVPDLSDGERSAGIVPKDRAVFSGEYSVKNSDEQGQYKYSQAIGPINISGSIAEIILKRDQEADHAPEREETCIDKGTNSEDAGTDEGGSSKGHKGKCDEDGEFSASIQLDAEGRPGIMPGEKEFTPGKYSVKDFDEKVMFHGLPSVAPTNCTRDHEENLVAEGNEGYSYKDKHTELIDADETGCLKSHKSSKDEDCEFTVSNLFNGETSSKITPQDRGIVSTEYSIKEYTEQVFPYFPAVSTMCANSDEVKFSADSSNLQEIGPFNPISISERQAEQPKSPLDKPTAVANTIEGLEAWSNASEMEGHVMCLLKTDAKGNIGQVVEGSSTDVDANDPRFGEDKEYFAGACIHDKKFDRNVMSIMECFDTPKENAVTQNKSDETVQDAGYELEDIFCLGDPFSDNGKDVTSQVLNKVEIAELVNASSTVLSKAEFDRCEASKEQLTENTDDCLKETNLITEEYKGENVILLGESFLFYEAPGNDSESTAKSVISSSSSPRTSDKLEGCRDVLIDTDLSESLRSRSRVYHKSEEKMGQSSEAAFDLSDADLQKSDVPERSHHLSACAEDGNILRDTPIQFLRGPPDAEVAKIGSFNGHKDVIEKGTSPHLFLKASTDYEEVIDYDSIREDDNQSGAKIWDRTESNRRSSQDTFDELHDNREVAILKRLSIDYDLCQDADQLPSSLELESTCKEAKETGTTTKNVDDIFAAAERGSSVCGAVSGILGSSTMDLHLGDHENGGDIEGLEVGTSVFNLDGDHEKNGKAAEENSTCNIVQFSVQEFRHFKEKIEETINDDINPILDVPASECNEILKESDVTNTIKEYIDSESSLSVIFENSGVGPPIDALAHIEERTACENAALFEFEEDIARRPANTEGEDDEPSVDGVATENEGLVEATYFMEPAPGSGKAVKSPARVEFLPEGPTLTEPLVEEAKGFAGELDPQKQTEAEDGHRSSPKELSSTVKKNARTILIHGTPGKLLTMADMKENAPTRKSSNVGDVTTVRPARRRGALQDVEWN